MVLLTGDTPMLALLLTALLAQAQPPSAPPSPVSPTRSDPCARASDCRIVRDFELRGPQGQRLPVRTGERPTPWLPQGNVMLFPGESVTVRLEPEGGRLQPRLVRTGDASSRQAPGEGEMRLSFAQARDAAVILTVDSRLPQALDYSVVAVSAVSGPYTPPVQTLRPGATTTERWTGAIAQVALADFRPTEPRAAEAGPAATSAPVVDGGRLTLPLGRSVLVRFGETTGRELSPAVIESGPAEGPMRQGFTAALAARAAEVQARERRETVTPLVGPQGRASPKPPAGTVRLTFGRGPDGRSVLLIVQNGTEGVLDYQGSLRFADGRRTRTTTCRVPPDFPVVESWGDPIVALELERFELRPGGADRRAQATVCD